MNHIIKIESGECHIDACKVDFVTLRCGRVLAIRDRQVTLYASMRDFDSMPEYDDRQFIDLVIEE